MGAHALVIGLSRILDTIRQTRILQTGAHSAALPPWSALELVASCKDGVWHRGFIAVKEPYFNTGRHRLDPKTSSYYQAKTSGNSTYLDRLLVQLLIDIVPRILITRIVVGAAAHRPALAQQIRLHSPLPLHEQAMVTL